MKRLAVMILAVFLPAVPAYSYSAPTEESEIEQLKKRVQELESQNRTILQELSEIKAHLKIAATADAVGRPPIEAPPASNAAAPPPAAKAGDNPIRWLELVTGQSRVKFYGFLRLDMVTDSTHPDNSQSVMYVLSEDPRTGGAHAENFTLYPRLTRLGINYDGPAVAALGNMKLSGQLEMDFQNGGRESRAIPRFRHAYMKMSRGDFFLLAGQTWDLISPLLPAPNTDTTMWNTGNLGDRRAQVQAVYEPKAGKGQLYLGLSAGLTGAVTAQDLDNNGFRDGEESGLPNLQGRIGYSHPLGSKGLKAVLGFWGHRGWEHTTRVFSGRRDFYSQSLGFDYTLPLAESLALRGEAWFGRNLSEVRGGIGQGINPATGAAIRSRGGWLEMMLKAHSRWTIAPGFTIDDPCDQDIAAGGRTRNRAWYLANRFSLGGGFLIGADYLRWITDYRGFQRGADNRVNIFFQYGY